MFRFSKSSTSPDSKKLSAAGRGRKRSSTDERAMLSDTPFSSKFSNRSELKEAHEKRSSPLIMHPLSRSRASTIASTTSSFASFSTVTNSEANSTRASSSDRSNDGYNAASERSWSKPRSFLTRRKSRRQNSKLGVVSTSESTEDGDDVDDGSRGRTTRMRRNTYDVNSIGVLKSQISAPFDFQHLTHTQHSQFPELDRTSQYELVAEFWAVRASQSARRDLRGIKAKDLYFENFSPEALAQQDGNDHASQDKRPSSEHSSPPSGPTTPNARRTHKGESTTVSGFPSLRNSSTSPKSPITPPPRVSSRMAFTSVNESLRSRAKSSTSLCSVDHACASMRDFYGEESPAQSPPIGESIHGPVANSDDECHAFTTPDDSAMPALSSVFEAGLEDVPEEPETTITHRQSCRGAGSPFTRPFLQYPQPDISSPLNCAVNSLRPISPKARPSSQMSDTLGSPFKPRASRNSFDSISIAKPSREFGTEDASWEADIDYCYEHAAEANCDFDWDHVSDSTDDLFHQCESIHGNSSASRSPSLISNELLPRNQPLKEAAGPDGSVRSRFCSGLFRPSLLVPDPHAVPDLDNPSARSASTFSGEPFTPLSAFVPCAVAAGQASHILPAGEVGEFGTSHPHSSDKAGKVDGFRDIIYEDFLDGAASERHYTALDSGRPGLNNEASSTCSSRVGLSSTSSYESSIRSSDILSTTTYAVDSRSSLGSLPDLVHSRSKHQAPSSSDIDVMISSFPSLLSLKRRHWLERSSRPTSGETFSDGGHVTKSSPSARTFFSEEPEAQKQSRGQF